MPPWHPLIVTHNTINLLKEEFEAKSSNPKPAARSNPMTLLSEQTGEIHDAESLTSNGHIFGCKMIDASSVSQYYHLLSLSGSSFVLLGIRRHNHFSSSKLQARRRRCIIFPDQSFVENLSCCELAIRHYSKRDCQEINILPQSRRRQFYRYPSGDAHAHAPLDDLCS